MKTFIITGVQMRNKGSQAMFLSLSSALKSIYNECEVIGFANKYDSPEQYTFPLMPYDDFTRFLLKYRLGAVPWIVRTVTRVVARLKKDEKWNGKIPQMRDALLKADAIFDASGYTLGSGWPKKSGMTLLDTIAMARRYEKPIILMPQSFGPFDWGEKDDFKFTGRVRQELTYPLKIYAREHEGYDCLKSLGLNNVELSADMVIRERSFPRACEIIAQPKNIEAVYPPGDAVGFIINKNVFRVGGHHEVVDLYAKLITQLINDGEKVCILNTSSADVDLIHSVLEKAEAGDKVAVISGDYSSPELIEIISRFKFIVASRYHSVVFAYRSGVPAVILGWASKYIDLAAHFGQERYVFDIRSPNVAQILDGLKSMASNYEEESRRINDLREGVQASSIVALAVKALSPVQAVH